jgi:hypothetical protein
MPAFAFLLCVVVVSMQRFETASSALAFQLPFGIVFELPSRAYHEAALSHPYHYLMKWQWYEWLGIGGPLVILWWLSRIARSRRLPAPDLLCRALTPYELICAAGALVLSSSTRFESLARIQPPRSLHLLYILLILFGGGILAESTLKSRLWRWLALFVPLCAGMWIAQRAVSRQRAH